MIQIFWILIMDLEKCNALIQGIEQQLHLFKYRERQINAAIHIIQDCLQFFIIN
jgi:hypothetical protein